MGKGASRVVITGASLYDYLGPKRFRPDEPAERDEIGLVNGLAWTSVGGEMLQVEVAVMEGSGKVELTGSLGDVMKESAKAAISYIRSRAQEYGIDPNFYKNKDIHIHLPEGAVPKDGPSAGVTLTTALVSALTGTPVRRDVAMTGEITLRGRVLAIGGLREKTMAAYRAGIKTVLIPKENLPDLYEVDPVVKEAIRFIPADHVETVLQTALCPREEGKEIHAVLKKRLPNRRPFWPSDGKKEKDMNFHNIAFESSYGRFDQLPPSDVAEIAFAGRSNVGKSSMINKIFNRKQLARVSAMPGKTVTINFFRLENVRFADLPGYGYAKVAKSEKQRWAQLIEGYFNDGRNIQLVFQLVDMRHPPTADDLQMIDYLIEHEFPFVVVLTKRDKLSKKQQADRLAALQQEIPYADQITMIPFSAETGEGVEEIRSIIEEIAAQDPGEEEEPPQE